MCLRHIRLAVEATLHLVLHDLVIDAVLLIGHMANGVAQVRVAHLVAWVPQMLIVRRVAIEAVLGAASARISCHVIDFLAIG